MDKTAGVGIDVVINTSNTWQDWFLSLSIVNVGGVIVNLGFPGRGQDRPASNPLDPKYLYMKNLTIKYLSSMNVKGVPQDIQRFNRERNLRYILTLIENGKIDVSEILSSEIYYTDLNEQYIKYTHRSYGLFSTLLHWKK
jgi:threonine dehydrogenase-like Zn-dependent dehydrogenase